MTSPLRHWFFNRSLTHKLVLIFFLPLLFLVIVSILTVTVFKQFDAAEDLLERSILIRGRAVYYQERLYSMQNAFRGYILTEDRSYLTLYDEAKGDLDLVGLELARLVQHSPSASERDLVGHMQVMTRRLIEEKDEVIRELKTGARNRGLAYVKSGRGQDVVYTISSLLNLFQSAEAKVEQERQDAVEHQRTMVLRVIVGGSVITLFLTGLGVILVARSVTKPMSALARAAEEIGAAGAASFLDIDRHDEVGLLSRNMAEMDRQIRAHIDELKRSEMLQREMSRNLALSELRYRSLVEQVPLGIFTTSQLTWTFANPFERQLMGLPEDVMPTFEIWCKALHPEDRERVLQEFESSVKRQVPFESEFRFMRPDGSVRHVLSRGIPLSDRQLGGEYYLCLDLDVTQMVELQQRLAPAERLATLTRMATSIAHDLRTPLVGLEQGLQGLKYVADQQLDPTARQLLEDLHTGARLAVGIVQDILDLYRQAYGELPLSYSNFVLDDMAREVAELMGAEARDRHLTVTVEGQAPALWGDRRRLFRVLVNLLDNALKNSPNDGRVRIVISTPVEDDMGKEGGPKRVTVAVEDEGGGLDADALRTLFQPSRQVSTPTRGGTGLGLYLCRLVIGAHKGVLLAHNRPEGGARFVFDIPLDGREVYDDHQTSDRRRSASVPAQPSDGP